MGVDKLASVSERFSLGAALLELGILLIDTLNPCSALILSGFALRGPRGELYAVSCGGPAFKLSREMLLEKVAPQPPETRRAVARKMGN